MCLRFKQSGGWGRRIRSEGGLRTGGNLVYRVRPFQRKEKRIVSLGWDLWEAGPFLVLCLLPTLVPQVLAPLESTFSLLVQPRPLREACGLNNVAFPTARLHHVSRHEH